jgi:hypothetical protein
MTSRIPFYAETLDVFALLATAALACVAGYLEPARLACAWWEWSR